MKKLVGLAISTMIFGVGCQKASKSDSHSQNQVTAPIEDEENVAIDKQKVEKERIVELDLDPFNQDSYTALINKEYSVDEDYVPDDLISVNVPVVFENNEANQLRKQPADQLEKMFQAAQEEGIEFYARSGYRSYQTQIGLYQNYVANYGQEAADRFSAKPGASEHQSGLAMDITSADVDYQLTTDFINHEPGQWLANHAHEFGFALRYPEGKEHITGYQYEPWHYRYFGEKVATYLFENQITYEELVEKFLEIRPR